MTRKITPRSIAKFDETVKRVDTRPFQPQRNLLPTSLLGTPGTDFGTTIVPRTTIPAATRTVQVGSDDFEPGEGTAYLFKIDDDDGLIKPRLDSDGAVIFKTVYNLSSKEYAPNDILLLLQDGSALDLQDDLLLELQADLGPTDYIGPETSVLFAMMDRSGKLFIPADEEGETVGSTQIAKNSGSPIAAFSGSTPGSGTVDIWTFVNGTIADSLENETVYNFYDYPVPNSSELIIIRKEEASGRWLVDMDGQHTIEDDQGTPNTETIFPYEKLKFATTNPSGNVTVAKASTTVTATIDLNSSDGLPIGFVGMGTKASQTDTGKEYIDRDGAADTDWALMDGASNATPGSGIDMQDFFVRGRGDTSTPDNTAAGRSLAGTPDDDEVRIEVSVVDHPDHFHSVDADTCDEDWSVQNDAIEFQFTVANKRTTGVQDSGQNATTLTHPVVVTLTNNQGGTSPAGEHIEMTPPNKKLHFFERVA